MRVMMAGQRVAARGRKVEVEVARRGKAEVRRLRMWARRGGEGVVRWEGVRVMMDVISVWMRERGRGGGVVGCGEVGSSSSSPSWLLFSCEKGLDGVGVGLRGGDGGGESGRVEASRFEWRMEAREAMLSGLYGWGRVVVSVLALMAGVDVLAASSTMALRTEKRDATNLG